MPKSRERAWTILCDVLCVVGTGRRSLDTRLQNFRTELISPGTLRQNGADTNTSCDKFEGGWQECLCMQYMNKEPDVPSHPLYVQYTFNTRPHYVYIYLLKLVASVEVWLVSSMFIILGRWVLLAVSMVTGVQLWLLLVGVECQYVRSWEVISHEVVGS